MNAEVSREKKKMGEGFGGGGEPFPLHFLLSVYRLSAFSTNLGMVAEGTKPAAPNEWESANRSRETAARDPTAEVDSERLSGDGRAVRAGLCLGTIC